ncbi:transposase [Pseudidiomarina gelatinasegens]|uniref:transposase n=1 Tax=Pseudidiomarina gelatinasegens TaxID=2487740 RepID=UPI003A984B2E
MPRRKRYSGAQVCQHIYDRGNNKQRIFHDEKDCAAFIYRAFAFAEEYDIALHAWVLMRNHFHFLLTPRQPKTISGFMQKLKGSYTQFYNRKYKRTGTIWEQRFKQLLADGERYILELYRYIELNPVRAGMVRGPKQYHWSSFHTNAWGVASQGLIEHPLYTLLGDNPETRQAAYREFIKMAFGKDESHYNAQVAIINTARSQLAVYGDEEFHKRLSEQVDFPLVSYNRLVNLATAETGK